MSRERKGQTSPKMASLNFENEGAEPPTKKQKITIETPSTIKTTKSDAATQPLKGIKMDDRKTHLVIIDNGFQPEREAQVGILHFVNTSNPGFSGTLKQRYVSGYVLFSPFSSYLSSLKPQINLWFCIWLTSLSTMGFKMERVFAFRFDAAASRCLRFLFLSAFTWDFILFMSAFCSNIYFTLAFCVVLGSASPLPYRGYLPISNL
jgi:hypothetical protein